MKPEHLTRLEAALRDANPVPRSTDLVDSDESAAVAVLVREGTGATPPTAVQERPRPAIPTSQRGRRAWAFAAGLAAMVLVVGLVAVLRPGGGGRDPVALDSFVFPAADVPAFTATVVYDMNPLGTHGWIPAEATVTARVLFANPEDYRYEVLSATPPTETMGEIGAVGLTILGAGDHAWITEPGNPTPLLSENSEWAAPVRHLLWDTGYPPWDEICSTGEYQALSVDTVAGRATTHGRCVTAAEDYELWVDTETGVVMKMSGPLDSGAGVPTTTRDGGFEIVEFSLGEVALPPAPGAAAGPAGRLPPLHAVVVNATNEGVVWDINYQDDQTWRIEVIESDFAGWEGVGMFWLLADGLLRVCDPIGNSCSEEEYEGVGDMPPLGVVPRATLDEQCDMVGEEPVIDRTALHYVCDSDLGRFPNGVAENIVGTSGQPTHYWVDDATSVLLRYDSAHIDIWVEVLEVDPVFAPDEFVYEPLIVDGCSLDDPVCRFWLNTSLVRGEPAPTFTGPLLDGTTFSLEDLRGRPVVVFSWVDGFGPGILEQQLDDFQALSEKWGDRVEFLSAPDMTADDVERIMTRGGYSFRTIICTENGPAGTEFLCEPAEVSSLWGIGWGRWVILDADGDVFDSFAGAVFDMKDAAIEAVLDS